MRIHERLVNAHPLDPEANNNLGSTLKKLKKFEDAKKFYEKAIALKPDYYQAIYNMGMIYSAESDYSSGLFYFRKLEGLNHDIRDIDLIISMLESRNKRGQGTVSSENVNRISNKTKTKREVIILNREVENELIEYLYGSKSSNLKEAPGPRFGKGRCSIDYSLFDNSSKIMKSVSGNLIKIIEDELNSKIFITDSFFNIFFAGGGITPHNHLSDFDRSDVIFSAARKYSLVYYLDVGDQNTAEPGLLKLYDPDQEILPSDGMIIIFPAEKMHSASYSGKPGRVVIGVNFYCV